MTKKIIKYSVIVLLIGFVAYNSVYFKSLSQLKAEAEAKNFDATKYAEDYLNKELPALFNKVPDVDTLMNLLKAEPKKAFKIYSNAMAIGNVKFFMTKGSGTVNSISDNEITLVTTGKQNLTVATEFIFGNALRDASGIIKVEDFTNSADLNNVSAEINKLVRQKVLPPFKSKVKLGDKVTFIGAFELNQEHINLKNIEIVPVKIAVQ
jgi:predicted lipoprotein